MSSGGGIRRRTRGVGVAVLAGAAGSMVWNALTVRDRAAHTGEADAAPGIAAMSWIGALVCVGVLLAVAARLTTTPRRPRLRVLWISGTCAVVLAYLIHMATATLWV